MPELNKANRQCADVDIRILKTMEPFLFFDTANTTTAGLSSDSVYAMAKGTKRIAFPNPLEGTMTIEAQVYPFKFFALLSNGDIETSGAFAKHEVIKCESAGTLSISVTNGEVKSGTVFVYPDGEYGNEDSAIDGSFAGGTFTATTASDLEADTDYEVGYLVTMESGIKKISFNNNNLPKDYYITQTTIDKQEDGSFVPYVLIGYKASIQRSFDLSFSSEGDPVSITLTFDLLEDSDGNIFDMIELTDEAE